MTGIAIEYGIASQAIVPKDWAPGLPCFVVTVNGQVIAYFYDEEEAIALVAWLDNKDLIKLQRELYEAALKADGRQSEYFRELYHNGRRARFLKGVDELQHMVASVIFSLPAIRLVHEPEAIVPAWSDDEGCSLGQ